MAENIGYIGYSSPSTAAKELLDEEMQNNPIAYPDADKTANCEYFTYLPQEVNEKMENLWISVKASDGNVDDMLAGGNNIEFWCILGGIIAVCIYLNIWIRVRKNKQKENY